MPRRKASVASSRRRGSKPAFEPGDMALVNRRLLTEAWIETVVALVQSQMAASPPHGGVDRNSFSMRARSACARRLLTEAWIETRRLSRVGGRRWSPPHGGVDRNDLAKRTFHFGSVASSRRRGSKHLVCDGGEFAVRSPPHGGVDRNLVGNAHQAESVVASSRRRGSKRCAAPWMTRSRCRLLTEAWIETTRRDRW